MKLITVLSFLIPFSLLRSICVVAPASAASTEKLPTTLSTVQSGTNFLLSDFPFMVEIKIYKYEILLCTKIGGFITKRWIIMTSYYEDNTPYLIFGIILPDYLGTTINTTKYFPYPKLLEHGNYVNNIALLDAACDINEYYMQLSNCDDVDWPSVFRMYKLQKLIEDDIVHLEMVEFNTTQKCHENMFELCYDDNNFETNTTINMDRHLNKDTFFIHFDINNSPILIGIQTATQRQQQQPEHYNDRKCNRFLSIMYFGKWICAVTGINNYFY